MNSNRSLLFAISWYKSLELASSQRQKKPAGSDVYNTTTTTPTLSIFPSSRQPFHLENVQKCVMIKPISSTRRNRWKRVGRDPHPRCDKKRVEKMTVPAVRHHTFTPRSLCLWPRQNQRSFLARYSRSTIVPSHSQPCEWRRIPAMST